MQRRRLRRTVFLLIALLCAFVYCCAWRFSENETEPVLHFENGVIFEYEPYMEYGMQTGVDIDTSVFEDPWTKNNRDLVAFAQIAWENQWGYVWGTFGDVLTAKLLSNKLDQYPEGVGDYEEFIRGHWMGRRTADCVGLIKAYGWLDPATGEISYRAGDMPDCSTETMFAAATESGSVETIPEIPGLIVYREGHVGIYIGGGFVIEAKGTEIGVVKTKLAESEFTHWFKCPYIEYAE